MEHRFSGPRERARPTTEREPSPIRALIVDDERLFAEALTSVLDEHGVVVDRIIPNGTGLGYGPVGDPPEVVILCVDRPMEAEGRYGQAILDGCPAARVLVLATTTDPSQVQRISRFGFHGCLSKDASVSELVRTLRRMASGVRSGGAKTPVPGSRRIRPVLEEPGLTPREREVLELIVTGAAGRTIAARLGISENTVRTHTQSILVKLRAHSRLEAATFAVRSGMVRVGPLSEGLAG